MRPEVWNECFFCTLSSNLFRPITNVEKRYLRQSQPAERAVRLRLKYHNRRSQVFFKWFQDRGQCSIGCQDLPTIFWPLALLEVLMAPSLLLLSPAVRCSKRRTIPYFRKVADHDSLLCYYVLM